MTMEALLVLAPHRGRACNEEMELAQISLANGIMQPIMPNQLQSSQSLQAMRSIACFAGTCVVQTTFLVLHGLVLSSKAPC